MCLIYLLLKIISNCKELFCVSLYNNGYNALHAKDGIEALDILEHHFIDLIISDIMMPNMDGFQLVI